MSLYNNDYYDIIFIYCHIISGIFVYIICSWCTLILTDPITYLSPCVYKP